MSYSGGGEGSPVLRVNVADLLGSAAHVTDQGANLAAEHLSSDNRIEAAQSGWVGTSATALAVRWEAWLAASRALLSQVSDHAQGLHSAAIRYAAAESDGAAAMRSVLAPDSTGWTG